MMASGRRWLTGLLGVALLTACQTLRKGDLLFHASLQGNHITDVTPGMLDHVAIYLGDGLVVEALPRKGVVITELTTLLTREDGSYYRGRVQGADGRHSTERALRYRGMPYDSLYLEGNGAVYCSELVVMSIIDSEGRQLLQQVPMTFRDSTGRIGTYWQQLYSRNGLRVPEGAPGSNPSELAQRRGVIIKKLKR